MSRITTGIGLASGINIEDIVTKLMDIERQPVKALQTRIDDINSKKTLFAALTAMLLKVKLDTDAFHGEHNILKSRKTTSSNPSVLTATALKGTPLGNYSFTVKSLVQAHQAVSGGFAAPDAAVGAGTITIEMGNGFVDRETPLDALNGARGVASGSIAITDRSGRTVVVDLSGAITAQDVIDAINTTTGVGVRASAEGDHFVLTDTTGQSAWNLAVAEVGGGATAADLGILQSVAAGVLTGADVVTISGATMLDTLNDGLGVRTAEGLDDFRITRRDGVTIDVNISSAQDVQDVIDAINGDAANADGKLVAAVSADGLGLVLTDTTGQSGALSVTALNGSFAAADLGILTSAAGDVLSGSRVIAELNTVLLKSLRGGAGVAAGSITITNHAGASAAVDLSGARNLSDVIWAINASGLNVTAALNAAKTGLVLADASSGSNAFAVEESGSTTAADLGILQSTTGAAIRGSNLELQYVSERTLLSSLNGGQGVFKGSFRVTNRAGLSAVVDLSQADDVRIEDVISEINSKGINVTASINSTGDGILLTDTSGGSGTLKVADTDGTTARDLRLAGEAASGDPTHIDGSFEYRIAVDAGDTIQEIANKIEASGAPVSAMIVNDGSRTNPYRLGLVSAISGSTGRMVIDTGGIGIDFATTQAAEDAVILYGQNVPGAGRMVVTSTANTITGLVDGLTLDLVGVSDSPVNVSVTSDSEAIVDSVTEFVADWNDTIDKIQQVTKYDSDTQTAGPLLGDPTVMRIEDLLNRMVSYNVPGASAKLNRLSRIGVTFLETGKISFDSAKLTQALATDRQDVEAFFTTEDTGFGAYASGVLDKLTDEYGGVIKRQSDLYDGQVEVFQSQIDNLTARLDMVQSRLYTEFYAMEEALSILQSQRTAIENMPNYLTYSSKSSQSS